jgi:hypothetical protein
MMERDATKGKATGLHGLDSMCLPVPAIQRLDEIGQYLDLRFVEGE